MRCPTRSTRVAGLCAARGNELIRNSTCALGSATVMLDFSGEEKGPSPLHQWRDVGRRAEVGVSKDAHIRRWPEKVERNGAIEPSSPVLLLKANRLAVVPSIDDVLLLCLCCRISHNDGKPEG